MKSGNIKNGKKHSRARFFLFETERERRERDERETRERDEREREERRVLESWRFLLAEGLRE